MKQSATALKISKASDGAAEYSISEKMRADIRGLEQCQDNSEKGQNMLSVASGAIDSQVELMKKIRVLAMKASDDTYTNQDRQILQKEVDQLLDEVEGIAHETDFNGVSLLDQKTFSSEDRWFDVNSPYRVNPHGEPVIAQAAIIRFHAVSICRWVLCCCMIRLWCSGELL